MALFYGTQLQLAGKHCFSSARLTGEHCHAAFRQTANGLIQCREHRPDAWHGDRVKRHNVRQLLEPLDGNGACVAEYVEQYILSVKIDDFIRVFAGRAVRSVRIFLHDHAARLVKPPADIFDHFPAWIIVVAKDDNRLKSLQPLPAMIDPLKVRASARYRHYVSRTRFIQRHGIYLPFTNNQRLREGA